MSIENVFWGWRQQTVGSKEQVARSKQWTENEGL